MEKRLGCACERAPKSFFPSKSIRNLLSENARLTSGTGKTDPGGAAHAGVPPGTGVSRHEAQSTDHHDGERIFMAV